MKKNYIKSFMLTLLIGASSIAMAQSSFPSTELKRTQSFTPSASQAVAAPAENKGIKAYGVSYGSGIGVRSYLSFYTKTYENPTYLWPVDPAYKENMSLRGVRSGAWCDDGYYAFVTDMWTGFPEDPYQFVKVDFDKQSVNVIADYPDVQVSYDNEWDWIYDMSWDPTSKKLWGIGRYWDKERKLALSRLFTIDKNTGERTPVAILDFYAWALASDYDGTLYAIRGKVKNEKYAGTELVKLDKDNNYKPVEASKEIKEWGVSVIPDYYHSMEFNHTNGDLYYLCTKANGYQYLFKKPKGSNEFVQERAMNYDMVVGLYIPYEKADNAGAADKVKDLTGVAGEQGAMSATLSWTNPTETWKNGPLDQLAKVEIARKNRNNVIHTMTDVAVGQASNWTDNAPEKGWNTYFLTPYRINGEKGLIDSVMVYVGADIPGKPLDVTLSFNGHVATVTWTPNSLGMNNSWYDASTVKYRIVRQTDGVQVAQDLTTTTFTETITNYQNYSYDVYAYNSEGESEKSTSNAILTGPSMPIPYFSSLQTQEEFDVWGKIDANSDWTTWKRLEVEENNDPWAMYEGTFCTNVANDYLVTPPLKFTNGKKYKVTYEYMTAPYRDTEERFAVAVGTKADASDFKIVHQLEGIHTIQAIEQAECTFTYDFEGDGYAAILVNSAPEMGWVRVRNFSIREFTSTDLKVMKLFGNSLVNDGEENKLFVTVRNAGSEAIANYKVQIIDADTKQVLGESNGLSVDVNNDIEIPVMWTPSGVGMKNLIAKIVVDNDAYPIDNELAEPYTVYVEAAGGTKYLTVTNDFTYGWAMPFYLGFNYSETQALYTAKELQNEQDLTLTGIQFVYNGYAGNESLVDIPVSIAMKNTTLEELQPTDFGVGGWQVVFDGDINVDKPNKSQRLSIEFDEEFKYTGKNLLIQFIKKGGPIANEETHPEWHYSENIGKEKVRCAQYISKTASSTNPDDAFARDYLPFIRLGYKKNTNDIKFVTTLNTPAQLIDRTIYMQQTVDFAELVSYTGVVVKRGTNVSEFNVEDVQSGVYLLRMTLNGVEKVVKIAIK